MGLAGTWLTLDCFTYGQMKTIFVPSLEEQSRVGRHGREAWHRLDRYSSKLRSSQGFLPKLSDGKENPEKKQDSKHC